MPDRYPQFLHHGGADGVTGSCHRYIVGPRHALLVDCGLFQGQDADHIDSLEQHRIRFDLDTVFALVVTHVHIDHIGRTQELLYELEDLIHRGGERWQAMEIIVDSPLAAKFTRVYRELKPFWDAESQKRIKAGRHPLSFDNLYTVDSHDEHLQTVNYLAKTGRPAIVLAASGMAAGGRVVNYLKAMIEDLRHHVLFVGYQAVGTPGRAIQQYGSEHGWVELDGERKTIRTGVTTIGGYSAHADQKDLLNFVKRMKEWPKTIRLVHGDQAARKELKGKFEQLGAERQHRFEILLPGNE